VELLPARQGDAVLVSWGDGTGPTHWLLVDGGPVIAYDAVSARLAELAAAGGRLDLLVLSHVDRDHVEGLVLLTNDAAVDLPVDEVWYNGYRQLTDELGAAQGEILGAIINHRRLRWNHAFNGRAIRRPATGRLPTRELPGGLRLTVLAPAQESLATLRDVWERECAEAGLTAGSVEDAVAELKRRRDLKTPGSSYLSGSADIDIRELARRRTGADRSVANASCIVLLVEHAGRTLLLTADATPVELTRGVRALLAERGIEHLPLDALKVPHHGSARNINAELVRLLPARRYLFSTDGSYFGHPHDTAVATIVEHAPLGAELVFNYAMPTSVVWATPELTASHGYTVRYPEAGRTGVTVDL
jgi:beta-lactamase superfamily II metal-dependent hydrolase